jgi:ribosome biogenesis protein BRX1
MASRRTSKESWFSLPEASHTGMTILQPYALFMLIMVASRHRHLLNDIASMLPHSRKDAKFDSKSRLSSLNELAEIMNCNNVLFFEARKGKDLYVWASAVPNGPTVKFHLQNRT